LCDMLLPPVCPLCDQGRETQSVIKIPAIKLAVHSFPAFSDSVTTVG